MPEPEALYNIDALLQAHDKDFEFEKHIIFLFLKNIPETGLKLENACKEGDWKMVAFYAHKLKASIDLFNLNPLKTIIRNIEIKAKIPVLEADKDCINEHINFISAYIEKCTCAMKKDYSL